MKIKPLSLKDANAYVVKNHRHNGKVTVHRFSLACMEGDVMHGVAICTVPIARYLDDGWTIEVNRLCTDGYKNACSFLYSACARVAREMGYRKIITYILESESGISLKASGWQLEQEKCGGGSWSSPSRPREVVQHTLFGDIVKYPVGNKKRYSKTLNK